MFIGNLIEESTEEFQASWVSFISWISVLVIDVRGYECLMVPNPLLLKSSSMILLLLATENELHYLSEILGCMSSSLPSTYLGLPLCIGSPGTPNGRPSFTNSANA